MTPLINEMLHGLERAEVAKLERLYDGVQVQLNPCAERKLLELLDAVAQIGMRRGREEGER